MPTRLPDDTLTNTRDSEISSVRTPILDLLDQSAYLCLCFLNILEVEANVEEVGSYNILYTNGLIMDVAIFNV